MTAIEVSVRVRPFNSREMKYKSKLIVAMNDSTNTNLSIVRQGKILTDEPRKFTFDNSFWTHDQSQDFATNETVYARLGSRILDNAMGGFNSCLFAYGQTGSGKTYTMMGVKTDPGVIPRLVADLYQRAGVLKEDKTVVSVECSYLEIYNENVRDLLNPATMNKTLKVRQHPKLGVFVEGLKKIACTTVEEIEQLIDDGGKVRSVAATAMNATSSRSHAIITLNVAVQSSTQLCSQLHLVDLAGSERSTSTGATGDTLTEGSNINKSLTTLGMCLSRLAETAGDKKGHVPFRDSQLTFLLCNSLGGNSKTAMLANISPADINFDETLSTLRFAATTKKIKNNAVKNEDPQEKLIRELRAEIAQIKKLLSTGEGNEEELFEQLQADAALFETLQESAPAKAKRAAEESRQHAAAMLKLQEEHGDIVCVDESVPRFITLNENLHQLCRAGAAKGARVALLSDIHEAENIVGLQHGSWLTLPPLHDSFQDATAIVLSSPDDRQLAIEVCDGNAAPDIYHNGAPITVADGVVPLTHLDRVIIGPLAFRVELPADWQDLIVTAEEATSQPHAEALEDYCRLCVAQEWADTLMGDMEPFGAELPDDEQERFAATFSAALEPMLEEGLFALANADEVLMQFPASAAVENSAEDPSKYDFAFAVAERDAYRVAARQRLNDASQQRDAEIDELRRKKEAAQLAERERAAAAQQGMSPATKTAQDRIALAVAVEAHEEARRDAQLWKPHGPSVAADKAEYQLALKSPTLAQVNAMDGDEVLSCSVLKLRVKSGIFSRGGYHAVRLVIRPRFLYYFEKKDDKCKAAGFTYTYGCAVQALRLHEGKHAFRLRGSVPRKEIKTSVDNALVFGTDSAEETQQLMNAIGRLTMPVASKSVAAYLAELDAED
jgi:hypothetical protein